ncbi:MAG: DUF4388 domain-containing protein [Vicinamibacteria bacterium]
MAPSTEFKEAAFEFHRYLSDAVAPLMLIEEFGVLLRHPPGNLASETMTWIRESARPQSDPALVDQILHAIRKIAMMGEFDLVPRAALGSFLNDYCQEILDSAPRAERVRLIASILEFGRSLTAPGALLEQAQPVALRPTAARRMAVFLDQLELEAPGERRDEVSAEFMATAALESTTRAELDASLAPLAGVGIDPATENVLKSIAKSLPGWGAIEGPQGATGMPSGERLGAMRQIVALGDSDEEVAKRFRELVHAAIAQFNSGNFGRAQSVLILARQMATESKVKPEFVESLRNASDYLHTSDLRAAAEKPESLPALRTMMSFFHALSPEGLLKSLQADPDEARRHDLSSLLEAHGAQARVLIIDSLAAPETVQDPAFAAAMLRLLRRIPRPEGTAIDHEVDVVLKHLTKGTDPAVATQAIYVLGQAKGDRVERALLGVLRMYEGLLMRPTAIPASSTADDISGLLDRTCGALARCGGARCLRALVDHGVKVQAELGDCAKRLAEGVHADFSKHPELQARLIEALRAELPRGMLGFKIRKETGRTASYVRALSGTPSAEVRALFQEIVKKHGDEEFGPIAAEALEGFKVRARPTESAASTFSGDLTFFGLPMLLQTLAQGAMTGLLTLIDGGGEPASKLWLAQGRLHHATFGRLSREPALYELLIRPFPGTFAFVHRDDAPRDGALVPARELTGLVFEGVRRHDEWKRAAALIKDDARLAPTGNPRPQIATDQPAELVEAVWAMATNGTSCADCEAGFPVDSYCVRTLLASWVETDALRLV